MGQTLGQRALGGVERSSVRGAGAFGGPHRDKSYPGNRQPEQPSADALVERQQLEFLGQFSTKHAEALRGLRTADGDTQRERRLLGWCAQFSSESESRLRKLVESEAALHPPAQPGEHFVRALRESRSWDPSKHPRGGYEQNRGWWSPADGGSSAGSGLRNLDTTGFDSSWENKGDAESGELRQLNTRGLWAGAPPAGKGGSGTGSSPAFDFDDPHSPSERRGTWSGEGKNRTFRFHEPVKIDATGELIHEIKYIDNAPVLHVHDLSKKTVTIVLTGDRNTDIDNAKAAWKRLHPGQTIPDNATFHHDLLHAREVTVKIKGKPTKVLVGKMPLIPKELHGPLHHQGSASVAKRMYEAAKVDMSEVKKLAANRSKGGPLIQQALKKMGGPHVPKSIRSFVGRQIRRIIPIVGTVCGVIEFKQNAEAHGVAGAIARATPVLGDVIGAYDLGSEIAKDITDKAIAKRDEEQKRLDANVDQAWKDATDEMMKAFEEFSQEIQVTNSDGRVDPGEIVDAMKIYRTQMQGANLLKKETPSKFDFDAAAAEFKRQFKERLIKASQHTGSMPQGPTI